MLRKDIRNLGIIAHVDHGKTTLVDGLLAAGGLFAAHESVVERVMDSQDLEREKGITISAKNAAIRYKDADGQDVKLNIVDTPGHADFGGEVERILGSVDGAVLLVDAVEGPLPQTRFVLGKALAKGHRIILCINKVDRSEVANDPSLLSSVVDRAFDLFVELGATDEQCDFPVIYASARSGWATLDVDDVAPMVAGEKEGSLKPLLDLIVSELPAPDIDEAAPCRMQLASLGWSDYVGQLSIGRMVSGKITKGQRLYRIQPDGGAQAFTAAKVLAYDGLEQHEVDELSAGDIGIVAGCNEVSIGDTIADAADTPPFAALEVDEPTLRMTFTINTSPGAGRDGTAVQSRALAERLQRECRANVAIAFEEGPTAEQFYLLGRGELQFAILIETLRREGIEFMVGRPVVRMHGDDEPIEEAVLDLPTESMGEVTQLFQERKGILQAVEELGAGRTRLTFHIPTRGIIGLRSRFLTATRGEGLMSARVVAYEPHKGELRARKNGTLVADRTGKTTDYALQSLEERGTLFIGPGTEVYEGMVIGECARVNDMNVNPVRPKKLTNVRSVTSDGLIILAKPRQMSLEQCVEWIDDDEWIECTPSHVRIRKKTLAANQRSVIRTSKS